LTTGVLRGGRSEVLATDSHRLQQRHFAQIGVVSANQEMPDWMTVAYFLARCILLAGVAGLVVSMRF
jgi:hypothetical protein